MQLSVVVVAGGSGHRMGAELPKQYLMLEGRPVVVRTIEALREGLSFLSNLQLIWVHPKGDATYVSQLLNTYLTEATDIILVEGGTSRAYSVANGLQEATAEYLMVHDGVRPFVSSGLLNRLWDNRTLSAVVPAILPTDSIRLELSGGNMTAFARDKVRLVQTPQLFERVLLMSSYERFLTSPDNECTDDASIVERYSDCVVSIVEGEEQNIKLTTPKDMALAKWYLQQGGV